MKNGIKIIIKLLKAILREMGKIYRKPQCKTPSSEKQAFRREFATGGTKNRRQPPKTKPAEPIEEVIENKLHECLRRGCSDEEIEKMLSGIAGGRVQLFRPEPGTPIDRDTTEIRIEDQDLTDPVAGETIVPGVRMTESGKVLVKALVTAN